MQLKSPAPRRDTEENVLPLINIVFLLLIFFMLAGTIAAPDLFPIELPTSRQNQDIDKTPPELLISAEGVLAFKQKTASSEEVIQLLTAELIQQNKPMLIIKADMTAPAAAILDVINRLGEIPNLRLTLLADQQ